MILKSNFKLENQFTMSKIFKMKELKGSLTIRHPNTKTLKIWQTGFLHMISYKKEVYLTLKRD